MTVEADRNHLCLISATRTRANRPEIIRGFPCARQLRLAALCVIALLVVSPAQATTIIFSNVGTTAPYGFGAMDASLANAFAFTPTADYIFTSAEIDLLTFYTDYDGRVAGSLYTSSSGTPGTLVAPLGVVTVPIFSCCSVPSLSFESLATTFTQSSGPAVSLLANTEYWLVLAAGTPSSLAYYEIGGADFPVPQSQLYGGAWHSSLGSDVQFEINGTPLSSDTPEPATFFLIGSALALAVAKRCAGRFRGLPAAFRTRLTAEPAPRTQPL
jgi:hypothetical protein